MKRVLLAVVVVLLSSLGAARADQAFTISLDGLQETPPVATPGTGSGTAFYDSTAGTLAVSIGFSGLIAPVTAAHVHTNAPGLPGPVVLDLGPYTTLGVTSGTISGAPLFPAAHVANLLAGLSYVNIHTSAFPGGEIRGQLLPVPEPSTVALVGLCILGLGYRLRRRRT
jgi:hypothetical protein